VPARWSLNIEHWTLKMTTLNLQRPRLINRHDLYMAFVVTRREIQDAFRDWRIMIPIVLLTVFFPALMNFTAQRLVSFVEGYGATIIANQLIPFLLLVVGFFPMSFSLVIALEAFVGEKERKSLEPLLSTPLTNLQLYLGKMMASLLLPLLASYLGMAVYLVGLWRTIGWVATPQLFIQTMLLTTLQGMIMVAGAVVISSQATSVRASNLLASFIIVPMALLIQAEAAALFWGNHAGLWWLILALAITFLVLMRMGLSIFNREELLGREFDQLNLGWIARQWWYRFSGKNEKNNRYPNPLSWYRQTVAILPQLRLPAATLLLAMAGAVGLGIVMAHTYTFPDNFQAQLSGETFTSNVGGFSLFTPAFPLYVFMHNLRIITLAALVGVFTFGVLGVLIFALPWGVVGYLAAQFSLAGETPFTFLLATVIPHASLELPALLVAFAAGLRWHAATIAPPPERTLSEAFLMHAADFARILVGLVLPLLLAAAVVEAYVTPAVLFYFYG
jgi:uncharacterized membrane protein SpoIIM required for sporulation/ABC-type transport system involved in multi-copper enzyme maturation permease subunit